MPIRNIKSRQLGAWLLTALTAPLAQFAGGMAWQTVAIIAAICLGVSWLAGRGGALPYKWLCVVQLCWLVLVVSEMCRWITGSWYSGDVYPAVPLILLGLGAASAWKGTEQAARVGSTVFCLLALIYGTVLAAGVSRVELSELVEMERKIDPRLIVILLIPALVVHNSGMKGKLPLWAPAGILGFAVVIAGMITGGLSLKVAVTEEMPLYNWVRGLSIAGTLQRFEAVVSVALTMGWFALLSYMLSAAGNLAECARTGSYRNGVWWTAAASAAVMFVNAQLSATVLAAGSAVLWVVVPISMSVLKRNKKSKNYKNNA